jgi:hypothetical protein
MFTLLLSYADVCEKVNKYGHVLRVLSDMSEQYDIVLKI